MNDRFWYIVFVDRDELSEGRRFVGHSLRSVVSVLLLLTHLAELSAALIGSQVRRFLISQFRRNDLAY